MQMRKIAKRLNRPGKNNKPYKTYQNKNTESKENFRLVQK